MASLSSSRSVWFAAILMFLFFWNIFHNWDNLAPPNIDAIEEIPQETTDDTKDLSSYADPPEPDIFEPDVPADSDDYEGSTWEQLEATALPPNIKPPAAIDWGDNQLGSDGTPISSTQLLDVSLADGTLDPTVSVDSIISNDAHQGNINVQNTDPNPHTHDRPLLSLFD